MLKLRLTEEAPALVTCQSIAGESTVSGSLSELRHSELRHKETLHPSQEVKQSSVSRIVWTRPRKWALMVLTVSLLFGWRWEVANTPPAIPQLKVVKPSVSAPNARQFYSAAVDALNLNQFATIQPDLAPINEKKQILSDTAVSLHLIREGFAYRYQASWSNWYLMAPETPDVNTPVLNFQALRTAARLFVADAQVAAVEGRTADSLNASLDAVRFGQDISHGDSLVDGMVGVMCQETGTTEALKHVNGLTASESRTAIERVSELLSTEQSFTDIMKQERLFLYATMQKLFSAPPEKALMPLTSLAFTTSYNGVIFWYGKDGIFQSYKRYMDGVERRTQMPYQQAKVLGEVTPSIPLLRSVIPPYSKAFRQWTKVATQKRILLTELAIQAYRQEHGGQIPASLAELTEGSSPYLASVPTDLFSNNGADPLCYKNGVVYSVGSNGRDDGGLGDDTEVSRD